MNYRKCFHNLFNKFIPSIILFVFLLQIYAQYSTILIENKNIDNKIYGRNTITVFELSKGSQYYFNNIKIQQSFENNALMNIRCLKNLLLESFEPINYKKDDNKNNIEIYMVYYLITYDIICLIILCYFIFGSFMAGIIKIIYQITRFYFNSKMIKNFNKQMNIFSIIKSKIENIYLIRKWNIFNPEGYLVIEFLCNFIIIFDILLIIYIFRNKNYAKIKIKNLKKNLKKRIKKYLKKKIKKFLKKKIKKYLKKYLKKKKMMKKE